MADKRASATQVLGGNGTEFRAAMSADGRTVVTATGSLIRRWRVGTLGAVLRGHRGAVSEIEIAPSGRYLVSTGEDWTVRVWQLGKGGAPLVLSGHQGAIRALGMSPDSRFFATIDQWHLMRLWSPDGKTARELDGFAFGQPVFAPSGTLVAAPSVGHTVRLWDTATGESRVLRGHTSWVISVAFAPDGRHIAAGATDGSIRMWTFPTGESRLLSGHSAPVRTLAFAGPGRLVSADLAGHVRDTDIASGNGRFANAACPHRCLGIRKFDSRPVHVCRHVENRRRFVLVEPARQWHAVALVVHPPLAECVTNAENRATEHLASERRRVDDGSNVGDAEIVQDAVDAGLDVRLDLCKRGHER